jgi:hypothetical protein
LKLSIAFKKPHVKGTKRKKRRVATERSIDSEVTDNGKCQFSSSALLKNKRKGITGKMRRQVLRKYPPSKLQHLHAKFGHIDLRTLIKFKRNNKIKALGLPPRLLREYINHQCPICHTMKRRHPKRPSSLFNVEKCNFKPCLMQRNVTSNQNVLEQALEDVQTKSVPSFNPLSLSPVRGFLRVARVWSVTSW